MVLEMSFDLFQDDVTSAILDIESEQLEEIPMLPQSLKPSFGSIRLESSGDVV